MTLVMVAFVAAPALYVGLSVWLERRYPQASTEEIGSMAILVTWMVGAVVGGVIGVLGL